VHIVAQYILPNHVNTIVFISSIQRNIKTLYQSQQDISHVVKESLLVLNVSRIEIKENRPKINYLITVVGNIEDNIVNLSDQIQQKIRDAQLGFSIYTKLDSIIEGIKNASSRSMYFIRSFNCKYKQQLCRNYRQQPYLLKCFAKC